MAVLFAGTTKAPLTCIVMLLEITDKYYLLPVLMLACSSSYFVSTVLMDGSIYTLKLKRRGIDIDALIDSLKLVDVEEIMIPAEKVISLREALRLHGVPHVLGDEAHRLPPCSRMKG